MLEPRLFFGEAAEADLFILAVDEPNRRLATKIGGLPYWRSDRPWPVTNSGVPIPFLAQFDLSPSRDLIGDVEWDVILIFSGVDVRRGAVVEFQNRCEPNLLVTAMEVPVPRTIPCYACERWRTKVFPHWEPLDGDSWSSVNFADGNRVDDVYLAMEPLAMQIGRHPFIPSGVKVTDSDEWILCSFPSIAPRSDRPYPFLNRKAPLTPCEAESASLILSEVDDDSGFGVFYVVVTSDRSLSLRFSNL